MHSLARLIRLATLQVALPAFQSPGEIRKNKIPRNFWGPSLTMGRGANYLLRSSVLGPPHTYMRVSIIEMKGPFFHRRGIRKSGDPRNNQYYERAQYPVSRTHHPFCFPNIHPHPRPDFPESRLKTSPPLLPLTKPHFPRYELAAHSSCP